MSQSESDDPVIHTLGFYETEQQTEFVVHEA